MNVIFLDLDGVLVPQSLWGKRKETGEKFDPFSDERVARLNVITKKWDAKIVLSTDWRLYGDLSEMQQMFQARGVVAEIIGMTEIFDVERFSESKASVRAREILAYVQNHPEITDWIAIDDLPMRNYLPKGNFYMTNLYDGLLVKDMQKINQMINSKQK